MPRCCGRPRAPTAGVQAGDYPLPTEPEPDERQARGLYYDADPPDRPPGGGQLVPSRERQRRGPESAGFTRCGVEHRPRVAVMRPRSSSGGVRRRGGVAVVVGLTGLTLRLTGS